MKIISFIVKSLIFNILLQFQLSFACTCAKPNPPSVEFEISDVVFSGEVLDLSMDTLGIINKVTLRVIESWKGDIYNEVIVYTPCNSAACGFDFKKNARYLVYAYYLSESLNTNMCTRTKKFHNASEDLEFLKTLQIDEMYSVLEHMPNEHIIFQNYPNPFNPSTKIKFALSKAEKVKIEVYNIRAEKIETLLNRSMPAGYHEVEFNGLNLSSGVYLYRIEVGEWSDVKKMILVK